MDVTRDEIRTYTAGLVLVLNQQIATTFDGDVVVVQVDLLAQMDTDEVARAITALRENEDARAQLVALKQENEQLQEELRSVNQALGNAATPDQVQQAAQKRKDILNRVQSNAMVSQAWTNWVLVSPIGIPHGLLNSASGLSPANPHIAIAQQIIASRQPLGVEQPPAPGTSRLACRAMSSFHLPVDRQGLGHSMKSFIVLRRMASGIVSQSVHCQGLGGTR